MSVLWILPLLFVAAGALFVTRALRTSADATMALRDECARLEELRAALDALRQEADGTRAAMEQIRGRSNRSPADR